MMSLNADERSIKETSIQQKATQKANQILHQAQSPILINQATLTETCDF